MNSEDIIKEFSKLSAKITANPQQEIVENIGISIADDDNLSDYDVDDGSSIDFLDNSEGSKISKKCKTPLFVMPPLPPKPINTVPLNNNLNSSFLVSDVIYDCPVTQSQNSSIEAGNEHFNVSYNVYANQGVMKTGIINQLSRSFKSHQRDVVPMMIPHINKNV